MDTNLPNPEIIKSGFKTPKDLEKVVKIIIVGIVLASLVLAGYYLLSQKQLVPKIPLLTGPVVQPTDKSPILGEALVTKAGKEDLYKTDLDYYLSNYFSGQGYTARDKAVEMMIDDSLVLQEGQAQGLISLNDNVFNSPNKNIRQRSDLIELVKQKIELKNIKSIDGEVVTMWFNNATSYPPPSIGVEKAKILVKQKMDTIYDDLRAGKITMAQAGQRIVNDSTQNSIDPSYKGNAYSKFTKLTRDQMLFIDPMVNNLPWNLDKNELSTVTLAKDKKDGNFFEAFFTIVKINELSQGDFPGIEEYVKSLRSKYEIIKY